MTGSLRRFVSIAFLIAGGLATAVAAGSVTLSNRSTEGDGRYRVTVDDYGAIDGWTSGFADFFNPAGSIGSKGVTFESGTFVFVSNTHRELLSDSTQWQSFSWAGLGWPTPFSSDTSLARSVTSPAVASDTNGDGYNDTAVSQFVLTGTGVDLAFTLNQNVLDGQEPDSAYHTLSYTITNQGDDGAPVRLVRQMDADLALVGGNANDSVVVGTGLYDSKYVGQNEGGDLALGYTMWSPQAHDYNGLLKDSPDASGTNYPIGATNGHIWENYGLPTAWTNHAGGIGTMTNGTSTGEESGTYLQWDVFMEPGASTTVDLIVAFGSASPAPEPSTMLLTLLGVLGLVATRRRRRTA